MTDKQDKGKESAGAAKRGSRKAAFGFVAIFMIVVISLLTGYRMTVNKPINQWYLFQVAKHTSILLDFLGHSSWLEDRPDYSGREVEIRTKLKAYREGEEPPSIFPEPEGPVEPLTAWEHWQYRIEEARANEDIPMPLGPNVAFVWKPSLFMLRDELLDEKNSINADTLLDDDTRDAKLAAVETKLEDMERRIKEASENEGGADPSEAVSFRFVLIHECGAIEAIVIFVAAVLAFPTRKLRRLWGVLLGAPILYFVNVFRLSTLSFIGAHTGGDERFDFAHEYVWQCIYIVFVVIVWLLWVDLFVRRRDANERKN